MRAAVLEDINKIVVREVKTPSTPSNGILVKVKSCAICGSDLRILHSGNNRVKPPVIIGHEISGEVVNVDKNVTKFKVGDRVAIGADVPCGECAFCEAGLGNNCAINYAIGYQFQGGYAEYIPINETTVNFGPIHKIPEHVSYDEGALAEPLGCVLNALELSNINLGDTVVVVGAGPIGCMIIEVAKKMGASKVIVVQRSKKRLEMAKKFNADVYISTIDEDPVDRVLKETSGLGADVIITACPSKEAQQNALKMANHRARINFFGGLPKDDSLVEIDSNLIHYKELIVVGSHGSLPRHHRKAVKMISDGMIDISKFMSHKFDLKDVDEALRVAESKQGMRVILNP